MSSFFTISNSAKKRKRVEVLTSGGKPKKARENYLHDRPGGKNGKPIDDDISSESEGESDDAKVRPIEDEDDEYEGETVAEKRLRLAQQYLDNLREEADEVGFDAVDIDRDIIADRLRESVAEEKGKIYRCLASQLSFATASSTLFRMNCGTTTAIAVCNPYIYTVTKDRYLVKWVLPTYPPPQATANFTPAKKPKRLLYSRGGKKIDTEFNGHIEDILCVAASQDGRFVVTGGKDSRMIVWDAGDLGILKVFKHHRAAVNGLVFRRGTNQLYSCSSDRTVKLWSLDELAYVETLFGHQDEVVGIAALNAEHCVTAGARDRTARLWKIVDETQLVFRGGGGSGGGGGDSKKQKKDRNGNERYEEGSIDCIAMIDDEYFVTGSDNGNICLWSMHKKKPVNTIYHAHGLSPGPTPEQSSAETKPDQNPPCPPQPRYITALAVIPYSDLIFSGSWDGYVRVWKVSADKKKLERICAIGIPPNQEDTTIQKDEKKEEEKKEGRDIVRGVVNGLSVFERGDKGKDGFVVCAGIGQEMRMGRWMKVKGRNGGMVMEIEWKALGGKIASDEIERAE